MYPILTVNEERLVDNLVFFRVLDVFDTHIELLDMELGVVDSLESLLQFVYLQGRSLLLVHIIGQMHVLIYCD